MKVFTENTLSLLRFRIALTELLAGTPALHVTGLCMDARLEYKHIHTYVPPKHISKFAGMRVMPQGTHLKYVVCRNNAYLPHKGQSGQKKFLTWFQLGNRLPFFGNFYRTLAARNSQLVAHNLQTRNSQNSYHRVWLGTSN